MADVYAVNASNAYNTSPPVKTASSLTYGRRRVIQDEYEAAALADGSDIVIGRVTAGTVILPQTVIVHDALGGSTTVQLKVRALSDATETAVSTAEDTSAAGTIDLGTATDIATVPFTVTEESDVILALVGAAATGTIKSSLEISVD